jgi:hypothetical protein
MEAENFSNRNSSRNCNSLQIGPNVSPLVRVFRSRCPRHRKHESRHHVALGQRNSLQIGQNVMSEE